ncbi:tetraacyldisaccharide 4'-kinase [Microvirga flavescens]|uniref:tetraacyldisaccharide 4'-kinase n=1 Tax=Microvirga flavescens TaxID=2249811 RepID=UPI000DD53F9E|nr:tetraacyldisaccharide 4'-kinase [Microvirga flavescens]
MRAPAFWWQRRPTFLAHILRPLAAIYGTIAARRMRRAGERATLPVICIGNFTAGGAGKTPTALAVAKLLAETGEKPAFLSRGYGGNLPGPVQATAAHSAADVGDEPLLLSRMAPVIVAHDRPAGAQLASQVGASVIVMDDGLQNPSLRKDLAIAVVDGATGIGNGLCIPAGPLRAPLDAQWPVVDAVLIVGEGEAGESIAVDAARHGKRVFRAAIVPDPKAVSHLQGSKVLAFAGIGRPEKFFETLRACGASVERTRAFPDHHPYTAQDLHALMYEAKRDDLQIVTTEKDLMRIAALSDKSIAQGIIALPITLQIGEQDAFRTLIHSRLSAR